MPEVERMHHGENGYDGLHDPACRACPPVCSAPSDETNRDNPTPDGRKAGNLPVTLNFDWLFYKWLERELKHLQLIDE